MFAVVMFCTQLQTGDVRWPPLRVSSVVQTRTVPPQIRMLYFATVLSHASVSRSQPCYSVVCHVMSKFVVDVFCCGAFFQVRNSTENRLWECDRENCPALEIRGHPRHRQTAAGVSQGLVWARQQSLARVRWSVPSSPRGTVGTLSHPFWKSAPSCSAAGTDPRLPDFTGGVGTSVFCPLHHSYEAKWIFSQLFTVT